MRARLLVLVVSLTSLSACGGGTFAARDSTAGSGGAETGGEGGGAPVGGALAVGGARPVGGAPARGGSAAGGTESNPCEGLACGSECSACPSGGRCQCDQGGRCVLSPVNCACISAADCPATGNCLICWDNSCVSPVVDCLQGKCVATPAVCPPNPCEGAVCGASCQLPCSPDTVCQMGFCDAARICAAAEPRCPCADTMPCIQPAQPSCVACPNATSVCQGAVCYNGQCQLTSPRCPCGPMQARGDGDCAMVVGWAWNGAECVALSGCGCTGPDCPSLYSDLATCKNKQAQCPVATTG
jgi:hypothetical protein